MTDRELQLTAFTAYDSDSNGKLDGTELVKSLIHWHGEKVWILSSIFHGKFNCVDKRLC